jgi:hypothetical protein
MLTEIESRLIKILQENMTSIPPENIANKPIPNHLPAIIISNIKFKFGNAGLVENCEQQKSPIEQKFNSSGTKKTYKLSEKPLRKSVVVEYPVGTPLSEKVDYTINYEDSLVTILKALDKAKSDILVRYFSRKSIMTLKMVKLKALYSIEVCAKERSEADTIAEGVVKSLLNAEDEILSEGIQIKPLRGAMVSKDETSSRISLQYVIEKEIHIEQVAEPIEKIEISRKNIKK